MPLSWNEIKSRSLAFSREWANDRSEDAEAKSFWDAFFEVFGMSRRRLASFEDPVKRRADGGCTANGYIDLFWRGVLLVEHKSRGLNLDRAYTQAVDYFPGIPERDLPRYVLVSDFARVRLYDLDAGEHWEFPLSDLHKHIRLFGFIAGYQTRAPRPQDPVNLKAAERMGRLHDQLKAAGYTGHPLEVLLVRLLFCLFADDTGLFQPAQAFREWLESDTAVDGRDLGPRLSELFQILNTPYERRQTNLDERLAAFSYVNGKLFEEMLPIPSFDTAMRAELLDACALDWGVISPAIFGGLFQSIMDPKARRNLGAHYTSETNILKVIEPLFLDELHREFAAAKGNVNKLIELQKKLRTIVLFDPACGCGNFLVVAYRELRLLELAILRMVRDSQQLILDIFSLVQVNVDQCFGIEIEEFPAQIAQVALWLTDHQMNQRVSEEFGQYYARLPLTTSARIVHGNALTLVWETVVPHERVSFILGNPPFIGSKLMSPTQRNELLAVMPGVTGAGVLDFVSAWYRKAADFIQNTAIGVAFVSTNSISQGEQPGILWPQLWALGMKIHFAHRTFQWTNEGRGIAAVHCVVIGFGLQEKSRKTLFEYVDIQGEPHAVAANNINPYLADASDAVLSNRRQPISLAPAIVFGSMPNDGGGLLLTDSAKKELLLKEPAAAKFIRPFMSAKEFLNNEPRWCLWLVSIAPHELRQLPEVARRVQAVKQYREASTREATRARAAFPTLFTEDRQPASRYILVPRHSAENRAYIPCGFFDETHIAADSCLAIPNANSYHFGILTSSMHNAWTRTVCGRIKSDYRYSAGIVYNNFPWPDSPIVKQRETIEAAAQGVLDARMQFPQSSLADLYGPISMPPELVRAHHALDRAVDAAYGFKGKTDTERVAFLFDRYLRLSSLLPPDSLPRAASSNNRGTRAVSSTLGSPAP